jgi:putative ABC transport system permease protein
LALKVSVILNNLNALFGLTFKRLWHNLGLSVSTLIGIMAVIAIVVCVPLFSHAVSSEVLRQQLEEKVANTHRSLFSLHYYFLDSNPTSTMDVQKSRFISDYLTRRFKELMGLKVGNLILEIESGAVKLSPMEGSGYANPNEPILNARFLLLDMMPKYAEVVEGEWPEPDDNPEGPLKVAVSEKLADEAFLNVGDRLKSGNTEVEITGIWRAKDPTDPNWINNPDVSYTENLWVPAETYEKRVSNVIPNALYSVAWYVIVDENSLQFQRAPQYAKGLVRIDNELNSLLPGIITDFTPLDALQSYQDRAENLITLLYAVSTPMIILAFLFITLTARITIQQYEQEFVTMRGRGTSRFELSLLNILESILLIIIALPLALGTGWFAANLMGKTVSFLKFTNRPGFVFELGGINLPLIGAVVMLIILTRFLPVWGISRSTIITVKQEQSRGAKKPLWERFYLDFILLAAGMYAYWVSRGWAKPGGILAQIQPKGEQYRDPLLLLAPSLFAMAMCMVVLRLVPLLLRLLTAIVERLPGSWAYLALQQLARRPQDHSNALLLIMISLSLSIYSASMAKTLDHWLYDSVYYQSGSDLVVQEYVVTGGDINPTGISTVSPDNVALLDLYSEGYIALEDHLKLPAVENVTRVGKYKGTFSYGTGDLPATFMGIDRLDFPRVAYYRNDFASESLGALMNDLGAQPYGVLIPALLAEQTGLRPGDLIAVTVNALDVNYDHEMMVVGTYDYFPTVYPEATPTLIVNLESIFDNPDAIMGYNIWMDVRPNTDVTLLTEQIRKMMGTDRAVVRIENDAIEALKKGQEQPERLGMFGVLNVGFLITGLMPGIGFVLYSYASLRRRFIQLGILQAIGLSVGQLVGYLVSEQFLLMGIAILSGAGIGLLTSYLFLPFLQIGAAPGAPVPPFQVLIGWAEAAWLSFCFGLVLILTTAGTIIYLLRLKVFQAVKLGESL